MRYEGRLEAGRELARELSRLELGPCVVAGALNGGIAVAEPVARQLGAPLVPLLTVELSTPEATDCPFGAVDADGNAVLDYRALVTLGLATSEVERIKSRAAEEVRQRLAGLPGPRLSDCASGRTVILVDEGLVSGLGMQAAVAFARRHGAAATIVAVPCASDRATFELGSMLAEGDDKLVCPRGSPSLYAAADYYHDFRAVSDADVARILEQAAATRAAAASGARLTSA
jgi:predicted phosphoribosyltransferase